MNRIFTLSALAFCVQLSHAQMISENFDSYTPGPLGPQSANWTTWSGNEGGTEDGTVSTNQAQSGSNSLYLNSNSANGGPQDVLLTLGQLYNAGVLSFESAFYIPAGKQAYFNFQAASNPGVTWGLNWNAANGTFSVDDGITSELATGSYPEDAWFTFKIEANLTVGVWKAYIDNVLAGVWLNGNNNVASINFYPHNASAQFYVDDVVVDVQPYTLPNLNAVASGFSMNGNIAGLAVTPSGTIINGGTSTITSFTANLNYNGQNYSQDFTNLSIASLQDYPFSFGQVNLVAGMNTATMTISNINGGADDVTTDNEITINMNPIVPAQGKVVVGEEGTGTWCQWCPRGAVYMDQFEEDFGDFWIGIAVHNGDPMTVDTYDTGLGALISGYPSALVDRVQDVDPSNMYNDFYTRLQEEPTAFISVLPNWDPNTMTLTVTLDVDFQASASSDFKLACVLTEDGVTGTGSGWSQSNAYAGGNNGVMGGYELLPNPVPASQMVYDHVARAIEPSFQGDANSFPATVNAGETHSKTYTFQIPSTWDVTNLNIIGLLIDPQGRIDNAGKFRMSDLIGLEENNALYDINLFPNPASDQATLTLNLVNAREVQIEVTDLNGKTISSKTYGQLSGNQMIHMNTEQLNSGIYFIQVLIDGNLTIQKLVVE